ncbi:MAG: exo-alpha-sialidase [Planctomycetes bacterium]|nr:exo-alpha-sialidase [Planctomycetota bacterium]
MVVLTSGCTFSLRFSPDSSRMWELRPVQAGGCLMCPPAPSSLSAFALTMLTLLAWLAAGQAETPEKRYVRTKQGERPKPMMAVDNACAWPNLTVLRDGTIVATLFNAPYHANIVGDVDCWASEDGGRTWRKRGTPAPHDPPISNRMNVAAGLARNGDLIVISSGWLLEAPRKPPEGVPPGYASLVRILDPWVCRSSDGGRTWTIDKQAFPAQTAFGGPPVPFGDIVFGQDGTLRVAAYAKPTGIHKVESAMTPRVRRAYVYRSRDDGTTWGEPVALDDGKSCSETALLHLGQSQWLAAARTIGEGLQLYESRDDARTWTNRMRLPADGYPGHFLRLRDGRLLLSFGSRSGVDRATKVLWSRDDGKTWSGPVFVVDYRLDGGYPSSVQLPDGNVLTAYYAREADYHGRYHMGVVIWHPETSLGR